jgi:hypothetical protein
MALPALSCGLPFCRNSTAQIWKAQNMTINDWGYFKRNFDINLCCNLPRMHLMKKSIFFKNLQVLSWGSYRYSIKVCGYLCCSWNFWGLSHACRISKMRHNKVETSVSPEKNDMIEKKWDISNGRSLFHVSKIEDMQMHILCLSYCNLIG